MNNARLLCILFISILLTRLLPHWGNFTAMMSASLCAGQLLPKKISIPFIVASLLISDILLSLFLGLPFMGSWLLFSCSGYALTTLLANQINPGSYLFRFVTLSGLGFFYWFWTNLGAYFAIYPHNLSGLILCYYNALPFLQYALLGNLICYPILLVILHYTGCLSRAPKTHTASPHCS